VRAVAVRITQATSEIVTVDAASGDMEIDGTNPRGKWTRTMLNSDTPHELLTADSEKVMSTARWEGDVHLSGYDTGMYEGGRFESKRYVEGGRYYCETVFTPKAEGKGVRAEVKWEFDKV
jgi:hypothetical protein